jgi:hypothetical protein
MKGSEIVVGQVYLANVSGVERRVKITDALVNKHTGRTYWIGTSEHSGRRVTIRGAGRLKPIPAPVPTLLRKCDGCSKGFYTKNPDATRCGTCTRQEREDAALTEMAARQPPLV